MQKILTPAFIRAAILAVLITLAIFAGCIFLSLVYPQSAEALMFWVPWVGLMFNASLIGITFLMLLGIVGRMAIPLAAAGVAEGVRIAKNGAIPVMPPALPERVRGDAVIYQYVDEDLQGYNNRITEAAGQLPDGYFLLAVKFRSDIVMLCKRNGDALVRKTYPRAEFAQEGYQFSAKELPGDYAQFVDELPHFAGVAFAEIRKEEGREAEAFAAPKPVLLGLVLALLFALPFAGMAQSKTERVKSAYPELSNKVVSDGVGVVFQFEGIELSRTGDGKKTIAELVAVRPGADADNAGSVKGLVIANTFYPPTQKAASKPQPLFTEAAPTGAPRSFVASLPDSTYMDQAVKNIEQTLPIYRSKFWVIFRPFLALIWYTVTFFAPIIAGLLGFFNFISRSAAQNANLGPSVARIQVKFAALAWFLSVSVAGCVFLCLSFLAFFLEIHPAWSLPLTALGTFLSNKLVNWLTPNGQYQRQVTVTKQREDRALLQ